MKKKKSGLFVRILKKVLLVVVIAAVFWMLLGGKIMNRISGVTASDEDRASAMLQTKDSTAVVTRGSIEITTQGDGTIEAADKDTFKSSYTVKIDQVEAENGDTVEEGDLIATVDRDSVKEQIDTLKSRLKELNSSVSQTSRDGSDSLTSPIPGRVKRIFVKEGDLLSEVMTRKGGIMEISADGSLKVEFTTDKNIKTGDKVNVSFLNYEEEGYISEADGKTYTAVIDDSENYSVDVDADVEDEDGNLLGSGKLDINCPYLVEGDYGTVKEVSVDANDWVDAGSTLLTRENNRRNSTYTGLIDQRKEVMDELAELKRLEEEPKILAEGAGIVTDMMLTDGGQIAEDAPMYTIISTDKFNLKTEIDELSIAGVAAGQDAKIVFDAFEDESYEGTVKKISSVGNNTNGVTTYTVTIELAGSETLKTNMSATATIVTDKSTDTLVIPVDAVQTENTEKYVTVVNGDELEKRTVTLGLVNAANAEVVEGLSEGETVVVVGTSELENLTNMMQASRQAMRDNDSDN